MKLNEFVRDPGCSKKKYRKGRGPGSGNGKTAGRGHKGQKARSGGGVRPAFEGGQMPLYRRLPKRGFNNKNFAKHYVVMDVARLSVFDDGAEISLDTILENGLVKIPKGKYLGLKLIGDGEIGKKLNVKAKKFTASAKEAIEKAGGSAEEV